MKLPKWLIPLIVLTLVPGTLTLGVSWAIRSCGHSPARNVLRALLGPAVAMLDLGSTAPETGADKPQPGPHPHVEAVHVEAVGHWTPTQTYTPADTLPVHVVINDDPDGPTGYITIGPDTVAVDSVLIRATVEPLNWRLFAEITGPVSADFGAGLAWEPVRFLGIQAGPYASFDVPDFGWASAGLRVSRRVYSTLDAGGEIGYRLGESSGLHLGISGGFAF